MNKWELNYKCNRCLTNYQFRLTIINKIFNIDLKINNSEKWVRFINQERLAKYHQRIKEVEMFKNFCRKCLINYWDDLEKEIIKENGK